MKEYSTSAVISLLTGVSAWITELYLLISAESKSDYLGIYSSLCVGWLCGVFLASLAGIALGIAGIVDKRRGKRIAVIGLLANLAYVVLTFFYLYEWD
jgi:Na+/H+ antiporter NhaA